MNEYEAWEVIKKQLCKEMMTIADRIQKSQNMNDQDLDRIDKIAHAKKSILTALAMEEAEGYGNSEYRGRGANGRYVSRESGRTSYTEGYSDGYSEAMRRMNESNNNNSGHYPMPDYPQRRW